MGISRALYSNGEGEVYEPSGITQNANGSVTLTAQPNSNISATWPNNLPYTSGGFSTAAYSNGEPQAGGFSALYGYFQMTAELPTGAGLWPAFWLEPVNGASACEIDVFEAPFNNPSLVQSSLHDGGTGYTTGQVTVPDYSTNYNTYGVNWSPTTITYYVNGQETGSTPTPASCNTPAYILANLAVGGQSWSWPGTPNSSNTWPASMVIQNITYNPNGPNGVGNDGGTYSGGLAGGGATSATAAATAATATPTANPATLPASGALSGTPSAAATDPPATTAAATAAAPAATTSSQQIAPGTGSVTDCSGNTWTITADNRIEENGEPVPGGGDTSALTMDGSCTVYGLSNGNNSKIGWFTLSSVTPGNQTWSYMGATAIPPTAGATIAAATPSTGAATPAVSIAPLAVQSCPAGATASTGGFHVAGGQIIGPDGKAWIARGVDLHDNNLAAAAAQLPTQFPGINLVRVASGDYESRMDPSTFADAVASLTARGTVVEFTDYSNSLGTGSGGSQGNIYTGSLLTNESAWFASMAAYYINNPYVWFGTNNEPALVYPGNSNAVATGPQSLCVASSDLRCDPRHRNKNPILLEPGGDAVGTFRGGAGVPMMAFQDPTVVATMTNVIWDPHIYGYMDNYATDAATNNALVTQVVAAVQAVQSADGVVPAIIGEYGPEGANGTQLVTAVINAGASGTTGSGAWVWDQDGVVGGPSGDPTGLVDFGLLSGGQLTTYGQMVALYINTNVVPLTNCQLTAQAQQQINTITAQVTAPTTGTPDASTPATTAPDTSAAATDPSTATLIQQGDAAVAQGNAIAAAAQASMQQPVAQ